MYKHTLSTLKNGLRLITVPMPQVESVTVMVGIGAGSRFETRRLNGLSHFIEHMAFKGTRKRPSTLAIASEIEGVGGFFNAYTDKEYTGYFIKLAAKHRQLAFDVLADMLTNSLLDREEIEREKGVISQEINMRDDVPMTRVFIDFERLIYGDNPMGWDTAGEKEIIQKIRRQDFLTYLKKLYYPQNMVVAIAGNINLKDAKNLTKQYFHSLSKAGQKRVVPIGISQKAPRLKLTTKKTEQAHFCLGMPGYSLSDKRRWPVNVLTAILGGGMSSRLFLEIRERRGLAYYVSSEAAFQTDSGYLINRAGVKLEKIDEAIKVVLEQLKLLTSRKVTLKELTKVKEMIKGSVVLSLEDSKNVAERYTLQQVLENKIRTPEQTLALIDKVSPDDVLRAALDLFKPEKLNLALVGPFKDKSRFTKLLK